MKPLTDRQRMMLDAIIGYLREHDGYPSFRELMDIMEISSTNAIGEHLNALAKKGYLERSCYESRSIRVLCDADGRPFPTRRELEAEVERLRALVTP
jgi:SOS-response transcriptional repressor LexA